MYWTRFQSRSSVRTKTMFGLLGAGRASAPTATISPISASSANVQ